MTVLNKLKPAVQQQVLWLHHQAFGADDVPCKPCGGACCVGCASTDGYLMYRLSVEERDVLKERYGFDPNKPSEDGTRWEDGRGFLTDKGCSLPITERSATCLMFMCRGGAAMVPNQKLSRNWTKHEQRAADEIGHLMFDKSNLKGAK